MDLLQLVKIYWISILLVIVTKITFALQYQELQNVYLGGNNTFANYSLSYINNYTNSSTQCTSLAANISGLSDYERDYLVQICETSERIQQQPSSSLLSLFGARFLLVYRIVKDLVLGITVFPLWLYMTLYPLVASNPVLMTYLIVGVAVLSIFHVLAIVETIVKAIL